VKIARFLAKEALERARLRFKGKLPNSMAEATDMINGLLEEEVERAIQETIDAAKAAKPQMGGDRNNRD